MKSKMCLWKQRHLMPLISEAVKWRGSVSLISEAVISGNCVSDSLISEALKEREDEGEHLWFQWQWIGVRMSCASCSHAPCSGATCLVNYGSLPLHCATLHMHHASMHHALCNMPHAPCTTPHAPCSIALATCRLACAPCCHSLSTVQLWYSIHPIAWWMGS